MGNIFLCGGHIDSCKRPQNANLPFYQILPHCETDILYAAKTHTFGIKSTPHKFIYTPKFDSNSPFFPGDIDFHFVKQADMEKMNTRTKTLDKSDIYKNIIYLFFLVVGERCVEEFGFPISPVL